MRTSVPRTARLRTLLLTVTIGATALFAACKNPIEVALDAALDFSGVYRAIDGLEVEFSGS